MGVNLTTVDLGTNKTAKQVSTGASHTCVILNDNSLKCWGNGQKGQLGYGNTVSKGSGPNQMGMLYLL